MTFVFNHNSFDVRVDQASLLNQEGYTVRGVQKLLRGKEAQAVDVSVVARELDEPPEQQEASPGGIDLFRLIALRDRLASALES